MKRKRGIASLDSTNERVDGGGSNSRDIFTNDIMVGKFTMNGSKTCQGSAAAGKKSENKAYEMIRQAIGYNRGEDMPIYSNFRTFSRSRAKEAQTLASRRRSRTCLRADAPKALQ